MAGDWMEWDGNGWILFSMDLSDRIKRFEEIRQTGRRGKVRSEGVRKLGIQIAFSPSHQRQQAHKQALYWDGLLIPGWSTDNKSLAGQVM